MGFPGDGKYIAHVFEDAPDANDYPDRVCEYKIETSSKDVLTVEMASGGGYVAHLSPLNK